MAPKFKAAPPPPQDLPICFHPGCAERAPYGYGCTLRSEGRHYCKTHRPREYQAVEIPTRRGPASR